MDAGSDAGFVGPVEASSCDAEDDWEDEQFLGLTHLPPGEEGFLQSHAGGEAVLHEIMDGISFSKRYDSRTRRDRIQRLVDAWRQQIPRLAIQYLEWKHCGDPLLPSTSSEELWEVEVISFTDRNKRKFAHTEGAISANETLVRHGFLGATPERPSIAISITLLEIYRQLRRVCPRLSLDALSRALCHLHRIPRQSHLADQLSSAYDCYLELLRYVRGLSAKALRRNAEWDQQNICPPCLYKTTNEPALKFSFLAAMDGNNSLKLVDSTFRPGSVRLDDRSSMSFRWIAPQTVDIFKDEVARKPAQPVDPSSSQLNSTPMLAPAGVIPDAPDTDLLLDADIDSEDVAWLNVTEMDELAQCVNACVERWRAAGPEARKKMFSLFAIAGIFLAVCRHGHVLVMCDMIRSGELMKYPLAIIDRLVTQYGSDICMGYDIMCAFIKTLSRSILGSKVAAFRLHGVVPSFHGHAHNRSCQLHWHPLYTEGVGLEDFEECERTFSKSNELASVTRLASPYHRAQHIDEHFMFHDQDKHAASGNFIYQNYRQALEKIASDSQHLAALEQRLHTTEADYEHYLQAERDHLMSLKTEPKEVQEAVDYMELLQELVAARKDADTALANFKQLDAGIKAGFSRQKILYTQTRVRTTHTRHQMKEEAVQRYEEEHGIVERWDEGSEVYQKALKLLTERSYHRAIDNLERLVVQRLFELTKLGMNGVGYKLRDKINKALRTRATAIQNALKHYNDAAALLNPPRNSLSWNTVLKAATVADFDLLRDTRSDIRTLAWAEPAHREATTLYFGIKRAKEEVVRLNVEITRLLTFMFDVHIDYHHALQQCVDSNPAFAHQLRQCWEYEDHINEVIVKKLVQTAQLVGFSGSLSIGCRIGREPVSVEAIPPPSWVHLLRPSAFPCDIHPISERNRTGDEDDVPRELQVDTDVVVQLFENLNT
ncbi:hypothetical protein BDN70DRAFT_235965 [Pholiota conissans]|uniref:CxC1-like cysteine cluster associated with KDZ transposases domain-containing protein n=1 Tax=Pholiota conissans TaxID=109636 RepID=A0A9P6D7Y5_9AGAR|nr:hypothetical protein BDN70DRAFT_235965 [Pholiota conissans]